MPATATISKPDVVRALAARVHYARHHRELRQRDVVARSGIDQAQVSRLERGHTDAKFTTLHRLSVGLDTTVSWLTDPADVTVPGVPSRGSRDLLASPLLVAAFAKRARVARARSGMSQRDLAEHAGMWHRTIIGYEHGENGPHLTHAHRLAAALGVPVGWVLAGEGPDPWD